VLVQAVVGLGIKVCWSQDELDRARGAARRLSAGVGRLPSAHLGPGRGHGHERPGGGSRPAEQHGRWRLAMDPGAFAVGAPDMTRLLAGSQAPVLLARGEHDAMNTSEQLARLGVPVVTLPGLGHNAHVESPQLAITVLDQYR
jgi:pimeloyl-ACP methyl ester carboxylesterase